MMFKKRKPDPEHVFYVSIGEGVRMPFCRLDEASTYALGLSWFQSTTTRVSIEPVETCTWCAWCGWRIGACTGRDLLGPHPAEQCPTLRYDLTVSAITTVGTLSLIATEDGDEMDVDDIEMEDAAAAWALDMSALDIASWLARRRRGQE